MASKWISKVNAEGRTALFFAAERRFLHIARELIGTGANIHTNDSNGTTTLMALTLCRFIDPINGQEALRNINFWVEAGVDIEAADGQCAWRALHYAAAGWYDSGAVAVRALLNHHADFTARDRFNRSPLMLAVANDNIEAINELVQAEGTSPSIPFDTPVASIAVSADESRRGEIVTTLKEAQEAVRVRQEAPSRLPDPLHEIRSRGTAQVHPGGENAAESSDVMEQVPSHDVRSRPSDKNDCCIIS